METVKQETPKTNATPPPSPNHSPLEVSVLSLFSTHLPLKFRVIETVKQETSKTNAIPPPSPNHSPLEVSVLSLFSAHLPRALQALLHEVVMLSLRLT